MAKRGSRKPKRGSRKPERASTRAPKKPQSSFPKQDTRPAPKGRGKSGSPLSSGAAKARGTASGAPTAGTSMSGKPTAVADVSKIPSTPAPRKTKPLQSEPTVAKKLTEREIHERENLLRKAYGNKRRLEREKKRVTADLSRDITELVKKCDRLHDEIESGYEQIRQGELPLEAPEVAAGAKTPTPGQAEAALAQVAQHVASANGAAAGMQPCAWKASAPLGSKCLGEIPLGDAYLDADGRAVCKACHDATDQHETWPKPAVVATAPLKCSACGAKVVKGLRGFVCTECSWSAIVRANGGAFDFTGDEPAPTIDPAQAEATRIEAAREPDDLKRAMASEARS